jgi:hypothetical protein
LITGIESRPKQFKVAQDRCKQIIEVVRDPAGKLADGLQFLSLMKLILDLPHLGNVAGSRDDERVALLPLRNENEHDVDRPRHTGHSAPGDITLVLAGPQAGAHVAERHLSRLHAQHLFQPAPNHLIAL